MTSPLCLLSVHAHPDDESSKGAGTVARYHAEGVHTVLVTCTGGEAGDILNPALDVVEVKANLAEYRQRELAAVAAIIGYDEVIMLGYRDSGMPDTEANRDPCSFAQAPFDEAVERLVRIIRRERPQVILTYAQDERGYRHPDHVRVHEISEVAFEKAADSAAFPDAGPPFVPLKMYYSTWARPRAMMRHERFIELGIESPYEARRDRGFFDVNLDEARVTTTIDLKGFEHVRFEALRAHATQIDPESLFWFGLPVEVEYEIHSSDLFELADSRVGPIGIEDDLFAGIRDEEYSYISQ